LKRWAIFMKSLRDKGVAEFPKGIAFRADAAVQAKGLIHTTPGQRPGLRCLFIALQANGLPHNAQ
jgi:hypothetical protein